MDFQHIPKAGNHQIVDDIDAVAAVGHISCERTCMVEVRLEPSRHSKAHQPSIQAVQRAPLVLRRSIVLAEGGGNQDDTGNDGAAYERDPGLGEFLLHRLIGKNVIAQQEGHEIEKRLVEVPEAVC